MLSYEFSKFSYWNFTSCLHSDNINLIEQSLTNIFEKEGHSRINKPPLPQNSSAIINTLSPRYWCISSYFLTIGLLTVKNEWTIIKTSPSEILCRRANSANRPILAELAIQTNCDAFHYSVIDGFWGALLEINASGEIFVSGNTDCCDWNNMSFHHCSIVDKDKMKFYDEPIIRESSGLNFFLLDVNEKLLAATKIKGIDITEEEKTIRERELELIAYQGSVQKMIEATREFRELNMSQFERTDRAVGKLLCDSNQFWHANKKFLLHDSYTKAEELEANGVKFLYFETPEFKRQSHQDFWEALGDRIGGYIEEDSNDIPF